MTKKEEYKHELKSSFTEFIASGDSSNIRSFLTLNSNLPGPRANLELQDIFAEVCSEMFTANEQKIWDLCLDFCSITTEEAPVNNPREFLPFCGTAALGKMGGQSANYRPKAFKHLKVLANDPRWRTREAVSHALTMILVKFPDETLDELESWLKKDNWLEMRAVAAAVASPSFLAGNAHAAQKALLFHRTITFNIHDHFTEKSEEFLALRKGIGFTLSIVVAALPNEGFHLLHELLELDDAHLKWIVKENIKKNRLTKGFPGQIRELEKKLID